MKSALCVIVIMLLTAGSASGRTVTDHAGFTVDVPDRPQRIVSLHDWTTTVMAHELGASLVASTGRLQPDGSYRIRGAQELFGLDFSQLALASVHGKLDPERIRALKPDLILASSGDDLASRAILSTLAPVLYYNPNQPRPMLSLYADVADWLGRRAEFDVLMQRYKRQLARVVNQLGNAPSQLTYVVLQLNARDGTLEVMKTYGALTTVMDDLGLQRMPVAALGNGERLILSPELIEQIDADYLITTGSSAGDAASLRVEQDFERIAPGALRLLRAYRHHRLLTLPRFEVYPPSFRGLTLTLDALERRLIAESPTPAALTPAPRIP